MGGRVNWSGNWSPVGERLGITPGTTSQIKNHAEAPKGASGFIMDSLLILIWEYQGIIKDLLRID